MAERSLGAILDDYVGDESFRPLDDILFDYLGESKRRRPPPPTELDTEERESVMESVEPPGFIATTLGNTTPGLVARAINRATLDEPYVEPERADFGRIGNVASEVGSILADPLTYAGAGLGTKIAARTLGQDATRAIARRSIESATTLGTLTAGHDPLRQYIETGGIDPAQTAVRTAQSVALGAALGPAGAAGKLAIPAEIGVLGAGQPLLEGRTPTTEDFIHAAELILGLKGAGQVAKLAKRLRERGPDEDPQEIAEEVLGKEKATEVLAEVMKPSSTLEVETPPEPGTLDPRLTNAQPEFTATSKRDALAALADKETVSRREYAEATGTEIKRAPAGPERKAQALAAKQEKENAEKEVLQAQDAQRQGQIGSETEAQAVNEEVQAQAVRGDALGDAPERATSIMNAVTAIERKARDLPDAVEPEGRPWELVRTEALQEIAANPAKQDILIAELKQNPRSVTDTEDALLLHRQVELQNEYDKVLGRRDTARASKNDSLVAELETQLDFYRSELRDLYDIDKAVGTFTSRGLNARKMMARDDFSLVRMLSETEPPKGSDTLTREQIAQVEAAHRDIAQKQKTYDDLVAREKEAEAETAATEAIAAIVPDVPKLGSKRRRDARRAVDDAWKDFESKATGKLFSNPLDPELIASGVNLAKSYIRLGVVRFEEFFDRIVKRVGKAKADKSRETLEAAWRRAVEEERPQPRGALESPALISAYARELAEFFVASGVKGRDPVIDAVHAELAKAIPGVTRRQAMDAISRYGQFTPPTSDQIKLEVRDLQGQMQQVAKLLDMQAKRAPLKTGKGRPPPSDEERRLTQQVNEMKRKGGFVVSDPEKQLKSALSTVKTRLTHQIADLDTQIATRTKIVKQRTDVPLDAEAKKLVERRDALKKEFDDIFGKRKLTDAQLLAMAEKAAERSVAEYERRIRENDLTPVKEKSKTPTSVRLALLRATRDALKAEVKLLKDLANPKKTPEEQATAALNASLTRRYVDYQTRIVSGDFAPKARKAAVPNAQTEKARFALEQAKAEWLRLKEAERLKNRTVVQKIFGGAAETLNTARAILTSMDFSAVLRQGGFIAAGHPIRSARALAGMFRSFRSEAGLSRTMNEIATRPNAPLYKRAGLSLTGIHERLSAQEEAYMSMWAKKIPVVAGSERAYVAFLNRLRADSFDAMASSLGRGRSVTEAEAKVIANFVNAATGRGNLGRFNAAAVPMATVFFAPRYVASRFQLLLGQPLYRGTAQTRIAVAKEYARTLTGLGLFYGLSSLALEAFDTDWKIELDPRSSDFGKIRIGQTRIDPLFGLQQATVLLSRLVSGETKTLSEKVVPIRGEKVPFGTGNSADVIARFLRTKLSPIIGAGVNIAAGRNVIGEPVTPTTVARDIAVPISLREIYDSMKAQGIPGGVALGILNLFGIAVQTYQDNKKRNAA